MKKHRISKIRKAVIRLVVSRLDYERLYGTLRDTCITFPPMNVLEEHMVANTDIHEHLNTIYMLIRMNNLKDILELGTRGGESTIALLLAAKDIGGHVTSVDIDECKDAKNMVSKYNLGNYWTFLQGDDLSIEYHEKIGLLFIDTSHTYEHTLNELQKYEPYVIKQGIIAMHDTVSCPDVLRAIEMYVSGRNDLILFNYLNCNGLGVIYKKDL